MPFQSIHIYSHNLSTSQHLHKRIVRDPNVRHRSHLLLTIRLLLQQFHPSRYIATVQLGRHILPVRLQRFARQHFAADYRLNGNLNHLARYQILQSQHQIASVRRHLRDVHNATQLVHRVAIQQHAQLHDVGRVVAQRFVIETGITGTERFQAIVKVENDLAERQEIRQHYAIVVDVGRRTLDAAAIDAQADDAAEVFGGCDDGAWVNCLKKK